MKGVPDKELKEQEVRFRNTHTYPKYEEIPSGITNPWII